MSEDETGDDWHCGVKTDDGVCGAEPSEVIEGLIPVPCADHFGPDDESLHGLLVTLRRRAYLRGYKDARMGADCNPAGQ